MEQAYKLWKMKASSSGILKTLYHKVSYCYLEKKNSKFWIFMGIILLTLK